MLYKTKTPLGSDGKPLKKSGQSVAGYLESLQLTYNANHELTKSVTITQKGLNLTEVTTTYQYDAFGRRISKHSQTKEKTKLVNRSSAKIIKFPVQQYKTKQSQVNYLWDGNRQLQEQTNSHVFTTTYEQDSFEPVARLVWLHADLLKSANDEIKKAERESWEPEPELIPNIQVYHYHNDHLGTPNELTNNKGEVVWLADYEAWGNTAKVVWREEQLGKLEVSATELQPLRFQGQFIDQETGLHYNRFRYYDPDLGMFISRDPIGLMGGSNTFAYAPNPTGWIDPFGLSGRPPSEGLPSEPYILFDDEYKSARPSPIRGTGPNGGRLQAHHGLQRAWAVENIPGYDPKKAPSITLETGKIPETGGSHPHTTITNAQAARRDARVASGKGKWSSTLSQELDNIVKDLKGVGFSSATIQKVLEQQYAMLDKLGVKYNKVECTK